MSDNRPLGTAHYDRWIDEVDELLMAAYHMDSSEVPAEYADFYERGLTPREAVALAEEQCGLLEFAMA